MTIGHSYDRNVVYIIIYNYDLYYNYLLTEYLISSTVLRFVSTSRHISTSVKPGGAVYKKVIL